jgi:hypothetical protein
MAKWIVEVKRGEVMMSYYRGCHVTDWSGEDCGKGRLDQLPDLVSFVTQKAEPCDRLSLPSGEYYIQSAPFARA